jgi:hypothetical protein
VNSARLAETYTRFPYKVLASYDDGLGREV